ncbi:hypothetical protein [Nocardia sp. NPDC057227]|uniref:hypothetical protein n=1 Tax=Nocardia sp. NPDC057227 TaxID=3346056 RepID=UPI00362FD468
MTIARTLHDLHWDSPEPADITCVRNQDGDIFRKYDTNDWRYWHHDRSEWIDKALTWSAVVVVMSGVSLPLIEELDLPALPH